MRLESRLDVDGFVSSFLQNGTVPKRLILADDTPG